MIVSATTSAIFKLISPFLTVILTTLLNRTFEKRPKLIAYYGYISAHEIKDKTQGSTSTIIHSHAIVIRNTGKVAAKNVRVGHRAIDELNYKVFPVVQYEKALLLADGGTELCFPSVIPNEQIEISYLYSSNKTYGQINTHIRSDEGFAKIIKVIAAPSPSLWQKYLFYFLLFIGASTVIYWIISLVAHLLF